MTILRCKKIGYLELDPMRRSDPLEVRFTIHDTKKSNWIAGLRNGVLLLLHHVPGLLTLIILHDENTVRLFLMLMKKDEFVKGI